MVKQVVAMLVIGFVLEVGCGIGTPTRDVQIRNGLSEPVQVYTVDRDPRFAQRIEAGEVWHDTWMYPLTDRDQRLVRVEADDLQGRPVFCADYGYGDLTRGNWRIEVGRRLSCSGPPTSSRPP